MREKRGTVLETGKLPTEAGHFLWQPTVHWPLSGKAQGNT